MVRTMYSTQLRICVESRQDLPLTNGFETDDLVESLSGSIVAWDGETEIEAEVGWGGFYVVKLGVAINHGLNAFHACDAISQELCDYALAVLDQETGDVRDDTMEQFGFPSGDLLILHILQVLPAFRGWNVGLMAAQQLIEYYGTGLVMCRPQPLQFLGDAERRQYHEQMQFDLFQGTRDTAKQKLREHWGKLGFQPIAGTDYLGLNAMNRRPAVTLGRLGTAGSMA